MMVAIEADLNLSLKPPTFSLLSQIEGLLTNFNTRAYIVGGFLRDLVIKRETADIDIALKADVLHIAPKVADNLGGKFVSLDERNGIYRIILPKTGGHPDDKQWQIDFSAIEGDIENDLSQRDFTIDAMAIDLNKIIQGVAISDIIDPFNGLQDIEKQIVKTTSDTVFKKDAVRLLRAVRLADELGFTIYSETEDLIRQNCHLIATIAGERLREELLRLLENTKSSQSVLYMDDLGLLTNLISDLAETKGVEQPKEHQWDVFNHSVRAIDAIDFVLRKGNWQYTDMKVLDYINWTSELAEHFKSKVSSGSNRRLLLKLAALLHDIAKPQTKIINTQGRIRFLGHPKQGASIVTSILERLRFSTRETKQVATIVYHHLRPVQTSRDESPTDRAIYRYFRDTDEVAIDVLFFSLADHLATRGLDLNIAAWRQHSNLVNYMLNQHKKQRNEIKPPKLINGHDLMRNLNLKPGPEVGRLLEAIREAHVCREIKTKDEALVYAHNLLTSKRGG
ncbi:MAG: CCA tRNA nucleotidyltransferase [Dehalococcoidia bacterium]|nr:MAG: CCA tRNA nucleotidyltransferase [Dehalococcoidia bacterium]